MAKIVKTNMSGHELTFEYTTDLEADALFDWHCQTASQCELWLDSKPQWFTVWNRNLGKAFECWRN
jgi:hypothetical protein